MKYLTEDLKIRLLERLEDRLYEAEQRGDFEAQVDLRVEIDSLVAAWDIIVGFSPQKTKEILNG